MQVLNKRYLNKNYITAGFRKYTSEHFPIQSAELNALMIGRLRELFAENADADPKKNVSSKRTDSSRHCCL